MLCLHIIITLSYVINPCSLKCNHTSYGPACCFLWWTPTVRQKRVHVCACWIKCLRSVNGMERQLNSKNKEEIPYICVFLNMHRKTWISYLFKWYLRIVKLTVLGNGTIGQWLRAPITFLERTSVQLQVPMLGSSLLPTTPAPGPDAPFWSLQACAHMCAFTLRILFTKILE